MTNSTAARRLAPWKAAVGIAVSAATAMGFAGSASAAIIPVAPGAGTLAAAISTANGNTDPSNTLTLGDGRYAPTAPLPPITKPLTITGDHANQQPTAGGGARVDCTSLVPPEADVMTVNSGVSVTLQAFTFTTCANTPSFAVIRDKGNLTMWNMTLDGNNGVQLGVSTGATATVNNSVISDGNQEGILADGTLVLNNVTITGNAAGGILNTGTAGRSVTANNSIISNNDPLATARPNCQSPVQATDKSIELGTTCGTDLHGDPTVDFVNQNGGPTPTIALLAGSPAIGAGNPAKCFTTDQRFFVHTTAGCDLGSWQTGATRDTTAPTCTVTRTQYPPAVPTAQQDVSVKDPESGIGPQAGAGSDAWGVGTVNPADAITNLTITNGTVSFTPFSKPNNSATGLVLTATKGSNPAVGSTSWKFTAMDWAGNRKDCA
jgi:hypothetical protein